MCVGKSSGSKPKDVPVPTPRIDPVSPQQAADALADPFGALARITGVHTSAQGDTAAVNAGKVQVNGPGTAIPSATKPANNPPLKAPDAPVPDTPGAPAAALPPGGKKIIPASGANGRPSLMLTNPWGDLTAYKTAGWMSDVLGGQGAKIQKTNAAR